jgi:murein L,D-transpeptidase YcbB/YkuD
VAAVCGLLLIPVGWCGCEDDTTPGSGAATTSGSTGEEAAAAADPTASLRNRVRTQLGPELNRLLSQRARIADLRQVLRDGGGELGLRRAELLQELYEANAFEPLFTDSVGIVNERAHSLLSVLHNIELHALDPADYGVAEIDARIEALAQAGAPATSPAWPLTDDEVAILADLAVTQEFVDSDEVIAELARLAAGIEGEPPTPAVAATFAEHVQTLEVAARPPVELELYLADALLAYAHDMHDFNVIRYSEEELRSLGGEGVVVAERLRERFRQASTATPAELAEQLAVLVPQFQQYGRLVDSLARYRSIVEADGWGEIRPRELHRGSNHPRVAELAERLSIEGFYSGDIDEQYGSAMEEAVRSYQESHQMEVTGATHPMFWRSINVSADRRLAQIELSVQRWRESRIGEDPYYVLVNIPDFHAEVWREGERVSRFRIVTGNSVRVCDPETNTLRYANATPLLSAEVEYLVFNPYWNVPERIRREELDLELIENPSWLQENGYEVVLTRGTPRIRQLPGPDNALGAVKFIFPNPHNVYMHDTPSRQFFRRSIRNFSHGCMRVQNPLEFAELLLDIDGQWDEARFTRIRESAVETTVHLETHVPVHVEYYVVRVDDEGRTNFLADVYRYDRARLAEIPPEPTPCEPVVVTTESLVEWQSDGTAIVPDGTLIHSDGTVELSAARIAASGGDAPDAPDVLDAPDALEAFAIPDATDPFQPIDLPDDVRGDHGP